MFILLYFSLTAQIAAESNYKKVNFTKIPRYPKKPRLNIVINQRPQGPSVVFKVTSDYFTSEHYFYQIMDKLNAITNTAKTYRRRQ